MADYISREANGDDYVRRADIIERFMDRLPSISVNYLCKIADEVPPADVRPVVRGEWNKSYADHEAFGVRPFFRYCSECHESTVYPYNFCPHCGADMRPEPPEREVEA